MDFKQWLINEMPINQAQLIGQWDKFPSGKKQNQNWDKASYNILTHDENFKKLKNKWSKVPQTFDMYFVKQPGLRNTLQMGEVTEEDLDRLNIEHPPINRANITVFFTNNIGTEKIPMTPWTVGHRFGHAVYRLESMQKLFAFVENDFKELMQTIYQIERQGVYAGNIDYEKLMLNLMKSLGTMRSAREGSVLTIGEFVFELFGQHIINGKITFNKEVPRKIFSKMAWGRPTNARYSQVHANEMDLQDVTDRIEANAHYYDMQCNRILNDCIGKIFVM